jgi:hypothetical protein
MSLMSRWRFPHRPFALAATGALTALLVACSTPGAEGDWMLRWEPPEQRSDVDGTIEGMPGLFTHGCTTMDDVCRGPSLIRIGKGKEGGYTLSVDGETSQPFAIDQQNLVYNTGLESLSKAQQADATDYLLSQQIRPDLKAALPLAHWTGATFALEDDGRVLKVGELVYDRMPDQSRTNELLKSQKRALQELTLMRMFFSWLKAVAGGGNRVTAWNTDSLRSAMTADTQVGGMGFVLPDWFKPTLDGGTERASIDEYSEILRSTITGALDGTPLTCSIGIERRKQWIEDPIAGRFPSFELIWPAEEGKAIKCSGGMASHDRAIAPIINARAKAAVDAREKADSIEAAKADAKWKKEKEKREKAEEKREANGSSRSDDTPSRGPASEALKTSCALQADESAYAFIDGDRVDTPRWRAAASQGALQRYTRCLNLNR